MNGILYRDFSVRYLKLLNNDERQALFNYLDGLSEKNARVVIDTGKQFYKSSPVNGAWFWRTVPLLAEELQEAELNTWFEEGVRICRGDWECALSFLKASLEIVKQVNKEIFLAWLKIGAILVRYSNHDTKWYFKNSGNILLRIAEADQHLVIDGVLKIIERSWQAAVACLMAWPKLSSKLETGSKEKILQIGLKLAADIPDDAGAFFQNLLAFLRHTGIDFLGRWVDAAYIITNGKRGVVSAFFDSSPALLAKIKEDEFDEIIKQWALWGNRLALINGEVGREFFIRTPEALENLDWPDIEKWVSLIERVNEVHTPAGALEFIKSTPEILLQLNLKELNQWVDYGLNTFQGEKKTAYFALKIQESRDAISRLRSGLYLEAIKKSLLLYCEGITAESVMIRNSSDLPEQIRGEVRLFGTLDTRRIYLPDVIKVFDNDRDNLRFYRVMMMHLVAHMRFGTLKLSKEELRELAAHPDLGLLFEYIEDNRVDYLAMQNYPGLPRDIGVLLRKDGCTNEKSDLIYSFFKYYLWPAQTPDARVALEIRTEVQAYWHRVTDTGASARESLILARRLLKIIAGTGLSKLQCKKPKNLEYRGKLHYGLIYTAKRLDDEINRDQEPDANRKAGVLNLQDQFDYDETLISADEPVLNLHTEFYLWLKKLLYKFYEDEQNPYRMIAYYDEWDRTLNDYKKDWCRVREILLKSCTGKFVNRTLEEHYGMINTLKRYFGMLRSDRFRRYRRQEDGEDIDIDAAIEAMVEKNAGVSPSAGFYIRRDKRERDVAVGFLLDLSYSTQEIISETGKTLLDVEMESVIVMAEALEVLGDKYAIYGFNSDTRDKINLYVVKDFDEPYSSDVKQRFGGLQSNGMTRLAAALRHAIFKMENVQAAIKILILLSDGRPVDLDYNSGLTSDYERFYPESDTRMALREAKMKGINPFCITVDSKGQEYLEHIFGNVNYIIIDNVLALPTKLTETYKNLTT